MRCGFLPTSPLQLTFHGRAQGYPGPRGPRGDQGKQGQEGPGGPRGARPIPWAPLGCGVCESPGLRKLRVCGLRRRPARTEGQHRTAGLAWSHGHPGKDWPDRPQGYASLPPSDVSPPCYSRLVWEDAFRDGKVLREGAVGDEGKGGVDGSERGECRLGNWRLGLTIWGECRPGGVAGTSGAQGTARVSRWRRRAAAQRAGESGH